jgi:hypothetical protein
VAATAAVNCVALTNVVTSADPFHWIVDPVTNPVPFTVKVNAGPPTVTEFGLKLVMANPLMVKLVPDDVPPPGFITVTVAVPAVEIWLAGTVAAT